MDVELQNVIAHFPQVKEIREIEPIQSGLINRTYRIVTEGADDYILQCINHLVFTDVELLQHNIECVTEHIRAKLLERGEQDVERKVLRFLPTLEGKTYHFDGAHYWRVCVYIRNSYTQTEVTPDSAYLVGLKFGEFESMLADLPEKLGETIPDFHNMEFRMTQLREAVSLDKAKRRAKVQALIDEIERDADEMCRAERLYREGKLPKRICHCDTKVSNMLFDAEGKVLCIIDLDTVMPSFVFSDFGDFLRTPISETSCVPRLARLPKTSRMWRRCISIWISSVLSQKAISNRLCLFLRRSKSRCCPTPCVFSLTCRRCVF